LYTNHLSLSNIYPIMDDSKNLGAGHKIPVDISTEIFIKSWNIYRKIIENDSMSHNAGYAKLKEVLLEQMDRPFTFLDLACGDAYYSSITLKDTKAREYIGIDVSADALSFARENLKDSGIAATFIQADFFDFDRIVEQKADVIWVGFSVHHLSTEEKLEFFIKTKNALSENGIFVLYEPIFTEGEDLDKYCRRFKETYDLHWKGLDTEEEEALFEHIRESEKPETTENWLRLGKEAGFKEARKVFSERTGLYEIFKFS